jgi:hypothetical protein
VRVGLVGLLVLAGAGCPGDAATLDGGHHADAADWAVAQGQSGQCLPVAPTHLLPELYDACADGGLPPIDPQVGDPLCRDGRIVTLCHATADCVSGAVCDMSSGGSDGKCELGCTLVGVAAQCARCDLLCTVAGFCDTAPADAGP